MIDILVAFAGITGIGKSYYKDKLCEKLGFEKIRIITNRKPRIGEKNHEDKTFVTTEELNKLVEEGQIAYKFELLGNTYAYSNEELFSNKNTVFEIHYETIYDWKKICPNMKVIYLLPKDINIAKNMLKKRKLEPEVEKARLNEIDEHYNRVMTDKNLINMFDYVVYNNYDEKSEEEIINLVKTLIEKGE